MTDPAPAHPALELRKYPNRRYYDTTRSRHVTLEEIQTLIRDGHEIRVTDSKSGEEITAKVLAQIILELDPPKLDIFPVPLLHRLIRANETIIHEFVDKYFNQALNCFLDSQRQFEQYLRHLLTLQTSQTALAEWTRLMMTPFDARSWSGPFAPPANPDDGPDAAGALQQELRELREQVTALREEVARSHEKD